MSLHIFILGREPQISIAEIQACFPDCKLLATTPQFLVAEKITTTPQLTSLGGTPILGHVFAQTKQLEPACLQHYLAQKFQTATQKQNFGLLSFGFKREPNSRLLLTTKKFLKTKQIKTRFVNKNFQNLTTPVLEFEILRKKGVALIVAKTPKQIFYAEVLAVQPFRELAKRDYAKPSRDARVGMLPPKLAQILLNLTLGDLPNQTVYDPFCGTGTILVEAGLKQHQLIGSDLEPRLVAATRQNLAAVNLKAELFQHDATQKIARKFPFVVTEGLLGPPLNQEPRPQVQTKIFANLTKLYLKFFQNLQATKVGITFPFFASGQNPATCLAPKILPLLKKYGWHNTLKQRLLYKRPQQVVGREIVILRPRGLLI